MKVRSRIAVLSAAAVATLVVGGKGVQARDLQFDPAGPDVWDLSTTNWRNAGSSTAWVNTPPDSATFGNTTDPITNAAGRAILIAAPIVVQDLTIGTSPAGGTFNFFDGGGSLTIAGNVTKSRVGGGLPIIQLAAPVTLTAGNHVFKIADSPGDAAELTINSELAGSGDLTLDNTGFETWGTLVLNLPNSYTGATNIANGRLVISDAGALGSGPAGTTIGSLGTLSIAGAGTSVGGVNITEPITIQRSVYSGGEFGLYGAALTFANDGTKDTHTITGPIVIDSADARIRVDTNTLVLSGGNISKGPNGTNGVLSFTGDFAGIVQLNGSNPALAANGILITGGVEVQPESDAALGGPTAPISMTGGFIKPFEGMTNFGAHPINTANFGGGINVPAGKTFTIDQAITGGGGVGMRGDGTLNLNAPITGTGNPFFDGGTVNVNNTMSVASLGIRSAVVNVGTGGVVNLSNNNSSFGASSDGTNGQPDKATVNLTGEGKLISTWGGDFYVSDGNNTEGTINISGNAVFQHAGLLFLARNAGGKGTINQTGGTLELTRAGNFTLVLGSRDGTGTYNLSGGVANINGEFYVGQGGAGQGVFNMSGGTLNLDDWFVVARERGTSKGTVDISGGTFNQTAGNFAIGESTQDNQMRVRNAAKITTSGEFWVANGSTDGAHNTATLSVENDAQITIGNWFVVGRAGASGVLNLSGNASITRNGTLGGNHNIIGDGGNSVGVVTLTGNSSININTGEYWVGDNGGNGTLNIQGGSVTGNNWMAIGRRANGVGVVNLSSGSFTKQGSNYLAVGSGGPSATFNQTGGTLTSNGTRLGEASNGTMNLSAGTATFTGEFSLGRGNNVVGTLNVSGTANVTVPDVVFGVEGSGTGGGTINLAGGTLTGGSFTGGANSTGAKTIKFDGGNLVAAADNANFIGAKLTGVVSAGGAKVNTNGKNVRVNAAMTHDGSLGGADGGLTKSGAGTLTLAGAVSYTGATTVSAGTLSFAGNQVRNLSGVSIANGAALDISGGTLNLAAAIPGYLAAIQAAYDHGKWDGMNAAGILITSAFAATHPGTGVAYSQSGPGLTLALTWLGDTNLDGVVTTGDLSGMNLMASGATWSTGDFNYDGKVTADDFALANLGAALSGGANIGTQVPEPTAVAAVGLLAAAGLLPRRTRKATNR